MLGLSLATRRARSAPWSGIDTIFQPWFFYWNLSYCVFIPVVFLAFQFCVFKTNGDLGFSFHNTLTAHKSPTISNIPSVHSKHISDHIPDHPELSTSISSWVGGSAYKIGREVHASIRTSCQDSEGPEYSPPGWSTYIRFPGTEIKEGKAPKSALLSLWESRSIGPGHLKGPSFLL